MSKWFKWVLVGLLAVALAASIFTVVSNVPGQLDNIAGVAAAGEGRTWLATLEGDNLVFRLLRSDGHVEEQFTVKRDDGGEMVHVADMAVGDDGTLYYLKHYSDSRTGTYLDKQELAAYVTQFWPFGRNKAVRLDYEGEQAPTRFLNVHASTSITLVGVQQDGSGGAAAIERRVLDVDELKKNNQAIKNSTTYPVVATEDVYQAASIENGVVYISMAGNVYLTNGELAEPSKLYPRAEDGGAYASFIAERSAQSVVIGSQTGGAIIQLFPATGTLDTVLGEGVGFSSVAYTGREALAISYAGSGEEAFTALMQNPDSHYFELVVSSGNIVSVIDGVSLGFWHYFWQLLGLLLLYYLLAGLAALVLYGIWWMTVSSRTILLKLVFSSVPLLIAALVVFGAFSYLSYRSVLMDTYQIKVTDQGAAMRVLFMDSSTATTFDKVDSPRQYKSTEYNYLLGQMQTQETTRSVYISSAYFTNSAAGTASGGTSYTSNRVYTGIDKNLPTLYPIGITGNSQLLRAYRQAALTGRQQELVIDDAMGRRVACITPVGSTSGDAVFLLETSVFETVIRSEIATFLLYYLLIAAACIVGAVVLLMLAFTRIVRPIRVLTDGLDNFTRGDYSTRIIINTDDELANMGSVFNKMAADINTKMLEMKRLSDTYYKFVPERILHLLGRQNLGEVNSNTFVRGQYCILNVVLYPRAARQSGMMAMTNSYFTYVHMACNSHDAAVIADSGNLQTLSVICPSAEAAVAVARDALASIDYHNAPLEVSQTLDASFLLHADDVTFAICGDEERYIPALLSAGLERVVAQCADYRHLSSRLLVTEDAHRLLEAGDRQSRFIGYAQDDDERGIGLYDFYSSGTVESARLIDATRNAFDKAMQLYQQQRWYDAKNLFAAVLRENHYDNVARHYIFLCEKKM